MAPAVRVETWAGYIHPTHAIRYTGAMANWSPKSVSGGGSRRESRSETSSAAGPWPEMAAARLPPAHPLAEIRQGEAII